MAAVAADLRLRRRTTTHTLAVSGPALAAWAGRAAALIGCVDVGPDGAVSALSSLVCAPFCSVLIERADICADIEHRHQELYPHDRGLPSTRSSALLGACFRVASRTALDDPYPPVGLLQSCPSPGPISFRFCVREAAARDHQDPAITGPWWTAQNFPSRRAFDDWFTATNLNSALTRPGQELVLSNVRFGAALIRVLAVDP